MFKVAAGHVRQQAPLVIVASSVLQPRRFFISPPSSRRAAGVARATSPDRVPLLRYEGFGMILATYTPTRSNARHSRYAGIGPCLLRLRHLFAWFRLDTTHGNRTCRSMGSNVFSSLTFFFFLLPRYERFGMTFATYTPPGQNARHCSYASTCANHVRICVTHRAAPVLLRHLLARFRLNTTDGTGTCRSMSTNATYECVGRSSCARTVFRSIVKVLVVRCASDLDGATASLVLRRGSRPASSKG